MKNVAQQATYAMPPIVGTAHVAAVGHNITKDKIMDLRIVEDYIKAIEFTHFQDFCDRMLLKLYPNDYIPVRAGGRNGDMKNDGYCFVSRIFFQAHATRGESANKTKEKIEKDLKGCLAKWNNIKEFVYITNDTLIGGIENFVDELRIKYKEISITTWSPKIIIEKIKDLPQKDIEYIIERNLSNNLTIINNDGAKIINQGDINIEEQNINF
ncbi:hypothetical protein [Lutibacter sp.]